MPKLRVLFIGSIAAMVLGGASAVANVGAMSIIDPDSHGDSVASAARITCLHGPDGVHGACVSAIASTKAESKANAGKPNEPARAMDRDVTGKGLNSKARGNRH